MFDKINISRKEHIPYEKDVNIKIKEHRAPTDESVKLLRELEDQAMKSVESKVHIKNNVFEAGAIVFCETFDVNKKILIVKFKLNDQDYRRKVEYEHDHFLSKEEIIRKIYEIISKEIAYELLLKAIDTVDDNTKWW